jgi:hypothetical protein
MKNQGGHLWRLLNVMAAEQQKREGVNQRSALNAAQKEQWKRRRPVAAVNAAEYLTGQQEITVWI